MAAAGEANSHDVDESPEWPSLADLERYYVKKALDSTSGNKRAAARKLGISRRVLDGKIAKLGLCQEPPAPKRAASHSNRRRSPK
jgi:DNA-binding NtrC family response regulator